jgi:hypothetical protein
LKTTKERWGTYQLFDGDEDTRHGINLSIFTMGRFVSIKRQKLSRTTSMEVNDGESKQEQRTKCRVPGAIPQDLGGVPRTISKGHGSRTTLFEDLDRAS